MKQHEQGIYLEFKRANSHQDTNWIPVGHDKYHAYLVYRDGKGGEEVFRGGPGGSMMLGDIEIQNMPLSESKDGDLDDNPAETRFSTKLPIPDGSLIRSVDILRKDSQRIDRSGFPYDTIDEGEEQNSNSVAASHLRALGFDPLDVLPKGISPDDAPGLHNTLDHNPDGNPRKVTLPMEAIREDENGNRVYPSWQRRHDGGKPTAADGAARRGKDGSVTAPMPRPAAPSKKSADAMRGVLDGPAAELEAVDPGLDAFRKRILAPGDAVDEAMLKRPADWTDGEVRDVMRKRIGLSAGDPDHGRLAKAEKAFFDFRYGTDPVETDLSGRTIQPTPRRRPPTRAVPATAPDGEDLPRALGRVADDVAAHAKDDGGAKAVKGLQAGLNLLPALSGAAPGQDVEAGTPSIGRTPLKVDGVAGPKTAGAVRAATVALGAPKVKEAAALGRFAERARTPGVARDATTLKKTVDGTFAPLFGDGEPPRSNPWGKAFQGAVNDAGKDVLGGAFKPVKEDGWIGPKTTDAFDAVSRAAGPADFARRFGKGLGFF